MAQCQVCGNYYDKSFEVIMAGKSHVFDSFECAIHAFECAIHALAPKCEHCGCQIVGHGVEANGYFFCCAHWASENGVHELNDRVLVQPRDADIKRGQ